MATADQYAEWIVANQARKGTPEFDTVAKAYQEARGEPVASAPSAMPITTGEKFVKGLRDPVDGGAQLLTNILPKGVVAAGDKLNNFIADKTGLVGRLPEGGVDQQVREGESAYQAQRQAAGDSGVDWTRMAGNIVSPANAAIAARLPAAATLGARMGVGAAGGAASSALAPVGQGDFATEKAKQIGVGAVGGAAAPAAMNALSRLVSPAASLNPQVAALRAEGVRLTVGQTMGGAANRFEEKLTSIPFIGDAIASARRGAAQDVNRAAFNRALAPVNQTLPPNMAGREAVEFTEQAISHGYDRLLPNLTVRADQPFAGAVASLRQMVNTGAMDPNSARAFDRILNNDVLSKLQGQGALTGQTFKNIESDLGQQVRRIAQSTDSDQRLVGDALEQVQAELRQLLVRSNPNQAQELGALNTAWANFKRVQRASAGVGAEDGIFSPAQLQSAVKAMDRSKDKGAFARGDALMQDLSDPAKAVLGSKVPDSGTPGRFAAGGLSFLDPTGVAPLVMGAGAGAYLRPAQNALTYLITQRPQAAQPVANALRQTSPMLVPLGAQVGLNALNR